MFPSASSASSCSDGVQDYESQSELLRGNGNDEGELIIMKPMVMQNFSPLVAAYDASLDENMIREDTACYLEGIVNIPSHHPGFSLIFT
jgi:hypothetical protein